jgi:uncharacterized protein
MTFIELAMRILREEKKPLSCEEIWAIAESKGYDKLLSSKGKTPWATLGAQLYVNVGKQSSAFEATETRPKRFYVRNSVDPIRLEQAEQGKLNVGILKPPTYLEKHLHSFLAYYAYYYLRAFTKTIQHAKSDRKEFGEWVHPDMIGCYFPMEDWKSEVVEFGESIGSIAIKLFSFEIKKELSFSNLREAFFQAVSNSSWAHEGYLVAAEISGDEDFLSELRRLSSSFGIGVIKILVDDPDSSEILFSARTRESLDWDAINKLTINHDFKQLLKRLRTDISSKEIRKEQYDRVLEREELIKTIKG